MTPSRAPETVQRELIETDGTGGARARTAARARARRAAVQRRGRMDPGGARASHRRIVRQDAAVRRRHAARGTDRAARARRGRHGRAAREPCGRSHDDPDASRDVDIDIQVFFKGCKSSIKN